MHKKIAVLVRDRQEEALRMSIGIILLDDTVDVYLLDQPLAATEKNALYLETLRDLEMTVFTNCPDQPDVPCLSPPELAERLATYDHVIPY